MTQSRERDDETSVEENPSRLNRRRQPMGFARKSMSAAADAISLRIGMVAVAGGVVSEGRDIISLTGDGISVGEGIISLAGDKVSQCEMMSSSTETMCWASEMMTRPSETIYGWRGMGYSLREVVNGRAEKMHTPVAKTI